MSYHAPDDLGAAWFFGRQCVEGLEVRRKDDGRNARRRTAKLFQVLESGCYVHMFQNLPDLCIERASSIAFQRLAHVLAKVVHAGITGWVLTRFQEHILLVGLAVPAMGNKFFYFT